MTIPAITPPERGGGGADTHAVPFIAPGKAPDVPGGQGIHALSSALPSDGSYVFIGQRVQAAEPFPDHDPLSQSLHGDAPSAPAPIAALYVPGAQARQLSAIGNVFYVPGRQLWHVTLEIAPGCSPKYPAPHARHADDELVPSTGLKLPAAHAVQATEPGSSDYEPGAHAAQESEPLADAALPGAHGSQLAPPLPGANVPAAHGVQALEPAAPPVDDPAAQGEHALAEAAPMAALALPGRQAAGGAGAALFVEY
jgi:hypothetical protein